MSLIGRAEARRKSALAAMDPAEQAALGQYFTPYQAALIIAGLPRVPQTETIRVLDPGAGSGMLKSWLFLMEAASSHGPVGAKRYGELSTLFAGSTAGLVYVSWYPDRAVMRRFLADLAWETEAWCASDPTHMIHLNGDKFLGPHELSAS